MGGASLRFCDRIAERVKQLQSYASAIRQITIAYISSFPGWGVADDDFNSIAVAIEADTGFVYVGEPDPLSLVVWLKTLPRFLRDAEPTLPCPQGVSAQAALAHLQEIVGEGKISDSAKIVWTVADLTDEVVLEEDGQFLKFSLKE